MERFLDGLSGPRKVLMPDLSEHADTERFMSLGVLRSVAGSLTV